MNQISHWLDASNIYGSSTEDMEQLRKGVGGQLTISPQTGTRQGLLPTCSQDANQHNIEMCSGHPQNFFAGMYSQQKNILHSTLLPHIFL